MPDEPPSASLDREITTNIVAAYVRRNPPGRQKAKFTATIVRSEIQVVSWSYISKPIMLGLLLMVETFL
jgi:hypothetical protein